MASGKTTLRRRCRRRNSAGLPDGHTTKDFDGVPYYVHGDVYYQAKMVDGGTAYAVVNV